MTWRILGNHWYSDRTYCAFLNIQNATNINLLVIPGFYATKTKITFMKYYRNKYVLFAYLIL